MNIPHLYHSGEVVLELHLPPRRLQQQMNYVHITHLVQLHK